MLFSSSILSLFVIALQGQIGSKKCWIVGFILALLSYFLLVFGNGLIPEVIGFIGLWAYTDIVYSVSLVYFNELLVNPYRNFSNVICRFGHASGALFGTFMTGYLSDYKSIISLYFAFHCVYIFMLVWMIPESPSFLLKQNKHAQLEKVIVKISQINNYPPQELTSVKENLVKIIECK